MNAKTLSELRNYWEKLRAGRLAPYRSELDPRKFENALEHMFILEQLGPSQVRVRLAGMKICEMMGMEVRGMPPEALMDAPYREDFTRHLNSVLHAPAVVELDLQACDNRGKVCDGHMLLLPLRSDFGEVTRVLGCAMVDQAIAFPPVNFAITGHRIDVVKETLGDGEEAAMPGFANGSTGFAFAGSEPRLRSIEGNPDAPTNGVRSRGHLRVV